MIKTIKNNPDAVNQEGDCAKSLTESVCLKLAKKVIQETQSQ